MSLSLIFLLLAFACFVLAAVGASVPRINLTPLGLALFVLSMVVT